MTRESKAPRLGLGNGDSVETEHKRLDRCSGHNITECLTTEQQRDLILDYLLRGNHLITLYTRQVLDEAAMKFTVL